MTTALVMPIQHEAKWSPTGQPAFVGKDILELPIVAFGPQMIAISNIDELRGHTQPSARLTHAAFEHSVDLQLASDVADVLAFSFKREGGGPRGHSKRFDFTQSINDFLGNAITEKFVLGIVAHVNEGENGDASLGHLGSR